MKTNLLLLSSLIATGCGGGPSEDDYAAKAAKVACEKIFECLDESVVSKMYDDEEQCRQSLEDAADGSKGDKADCDYDSDAANDCLDAYDAMDCADLKAGTMPPECDDVYDCGT